MEKNLLRLKKQIQEVETKLQNKNFIEKAPISIINKEKNKLKDFNTEFYLLKKEYIKKNFEENKNVQILDENGILYAIQVIREEKERQKDIDNHENIFTQEWFDYVYNEEYTIEELIELKEANEFKKQFGISMLMAYINRLVLTYNILNEKEQLMRSTTKIKHAGLNSKYLLANGDQKSELLWWMAYLGKDAIETTEYLKKLKTKKDKNKEPSKEIKEIKDESIIELTEKKYYILHGPEHSYLAKFIRRYSSCNQLHFEISKEEFAKGEEHGDEINVDYSTYKTYLNYFCKSHNAVNGGIYDMKNEKIVEWIFMKQDSSSSIKILEVNDFIPQECLSKMLKMVYSLHPFKINEKTKIAIASILSGIFNIKKEWILNWDRFLISLEFKQKQKKEFEDYMSKELPF